MERRILRFGLLQDGDVRGLGFRRESEPMRWGIAVLLTAFIAAGPIMAALAGVGVGGATGGITGALVGMGIPEYEAKRYEGRIKEGGILLSVHSDSSDWTKKAKEILERSGAQDVSSTGEASADFSKSDRPMPRAS